MKKVIDIILRIGKKGTGAKDIAKELSDVDKAVKQAGNALKGLAVIQAARATYALAELGAQSIRTRNAFVAISGGAEEAERRLDAMRIATRGALSEQQMMASANRLMQMGLANNADELSNLTKMATRLGGAMGKEAGPAIEEFALMLANQSIPRLDTFGISAGRTRTRILALMKANEGMTRETAFMTAVMEEGGAAMERLGEETEDEALKFEQLQAAGQDLKVVAGELVLALGVGGLAGTLAGLGQELVSQVRELEKYRDELGEAAVSSAYVAAHYQGQTNALELLGAQYREATGSADHLMASENVLAGRTRDASGALRDSGQAADEAAKLYGGLLDNVTNLGGKFASFDVGLDKSWDLMMKTGRATGMSVEEMGKLAQSVGIADESQVRATIAQYGIIEAWDNGIISGDGVVITTGKLSEANSELALAADAAEEGQTGLADAHTANADALIGEVEYTLDYFKAQEKATGEVEKAEGPMQALEGNTQDVAGAFSRAEAKVRRFRSQLRYLRADLALPGYNLPGPVPMPPNLPEFQHGGMHWGGLAMVGEGGPELAWLPRGTRISTAAQTRAYTDSRSYSRGGDTIIIQDPLAAALVMEQISGELADEIAMGM